MVIKSNENFGGDTVTISVVHITADDRIDNRERLAYSNHAKERKISILGFGERFFLHQDPYAIRQLLLKIKDSHAAVQRAAVDEILDCFDFSLGRYSVERRMFLENSSNHLLLKRLKSELLEYVENGRCSQRRARSILALVDVLPNHAA
jgi:hypothetical protein